MTVNAYLNWGRWVVHCADPNCIAATRVQPGQEAAICVCTDRDICQHPLPCGTIISVGWTTDPHEVEHLVADRPLPNRNWYPNEPLANLVRENAEHGL